MPLPEHLGFLEIGWWLVHVFAIALVYQWGYVKGRGDANRRARVRELEKGER